MKRIRGDENPRKREEWGVASPRRAALERKVKLLGGLSCVRTSTLAQERVHQSFESAENVEEGTGLEKGKWFREVREDRLSTLSFSIFVLFYV